LLPQLLIQTQIKRREKEEKSREEKLREGQEQRRERKVEHWAKVEGRYKRGVSKGYSSSCTLLYC